MTSIIILALMALVSFILAGMIWKTPSSSGLTIPAVASIIIIGANSLAASGNLHKKYYSHLKEADFSGNYIVKDKLVSQGTGRKIYILSSTDKERERFAELSEYPPKGYSEAVIKGVTMLIPEGK